MKYPIISGLWPKQIAILTFAATCVLPLVGCAAGQAPFPFRQYEGPEAENVGIPEAKQELLKRLPIGTSIIDYESLFKKSGGYCFPLDAASSQLDPASSERELRCEYNHGWVVQSGWICVIDYDPKTGSSKNVFLDFANTFF